MHRGRLHATGRLRSASCEVAQYPHAAKHRTTPGSVYLAQHGGSSVPGIL